jgi:transcriptional regulator with XRE-family HTH domain
MRKRITLGKAVKAIRLAQGRPAATFATECRISDSTLHNIESSHRQPSADLLVVIAHHLGVDVDAISYEVEAQRVAA